MRTLAAIGFLVSSAVVPVNATADDNRDFFEVRIRPLLIKHCLKCHGPKKQESGLRLDSREGWAKGGDRGTSIVPGKSRDSLLIKAINHSASAPKMPPAGKLSTAQIADLTTWIQRGAYDPRKLATKDTSARRMSLDQAKLFWSYQPIASPAVPKVKNIAWVHTPVDAFIRARLQERGLSPVTEADKRTLIRRATFDLTGLPPTPDDIRAYLEDDTPHAWETLVERLLNSPAYGERWGRHWLDVARYADTAGDGADYPVREAYKYRDWVIRAFNRDMPFDQFVQEQIAGDILARRDSTDNLDRYAAQVTATGFLAIGKRYGYKPSPDYQYLDFADVIDSVGRSLLGLTLGCARCHEHKYDAVSMADYYALYGILQSTTWAFPGGEEQKRPSHFSPLVPPQLFADLEKAKAGELARLDAKLSDLKRRQMKLDPSWQAGGVDLGFESQKAGQRPGSPWVCAGPIEITTTAQSPFSHVHPKGSLGVRIGSGKPTDGLRYVFKDGLRATPGRMMHFTVDFRSVAGSSEAGAFRFYLGRGVVQSLAVECSATATEFAIRNGKKWETIRRITPGTWYTLRLSIDPAKKTFSGVIGTRDDLTTFKNKSVGPGWDGIANCFICDATGHVNGPACSRDLDNIGLQDEPFAAAGSKPVVPKTAIPGVGKQVIAITKEIKTLTSQRQLRAARSAYGVAYGVSEATPVNARIQLRGEPHQLGKEIPRRFLEVLGGDRLPKNAAGSGRLELARWMTRRTNPLTARVFVNRVWRWHFGQGLVSTPSDFGARGQRPTHPRLLDWLAAGFIESGWSVKSLHRLIMKSRTYRLASDDDDTNLRIDPENRWHWRYSRRPLDAESIRDAMLALSGHLDRTVPQPHPFPPVNTWGFTIHHPFHAVYDSNHRSVYLMVQRNRRHPYLALFDAADPNQSVASRQPTTTPTQALYLMNSPFVHARSEGLAIRLLASPGDPEHVVRLAFEMAHGRLPGDREVQNAVAFVTGYREKLSNKGDPRKQDLAAWSALARVLLTSNAFLHVD
ncbi:MAG: PSD1 and planctomycete cytochrome C domain-containing protein [Planctomycetaceae bacterium]|jgi:mono/diheme cytochrome c family protein|nr:PSD1 and planctomycete cytochrome C domain-containing protein [Planctomycetaceae bacterium]